MTDISLVNLKGLAQNTEKLLVQIYMSYNADSTCAISCKPLRIAQRQVIEL